MKQRILLSLLLLVTALGHAPEAAAQAEQRHFFRGGIGYYNTGYEDAGPLLFIEGGRLLRTGFTAMLSLGVSNVVNEYSTAFPATYDGQRNYDNVYMVRLAFTRDLPLTQRHRLGLGTGLIYLRTYVSEASFFDPTPGPGQDPNDPLIPVIDAYSWGEAGLLFNAEYVYRRGSFLLGLRGEKHILYDHGFGRGFIITPTIGARF